MNEININNKIFKLESVWRKTKSDKIKDNKNNLFPYPDVGNKWNSQYDFVEKLIFVEEYIDSKPNNTENNNISHNIDCLLCDEKNISIKLYQIGNILWDSGLKHYIKEHNIKPTNEFIERIFKFEPDSNYFIKLVGRIKNKNDILFLKLDKNQLMILDALMRHGGYNKKYHDINNKNITRYSEHAGFLDIKGKYVKNIIVSGNTLRIDRGDEEIYLPGDLPEAFEYKYIFHTHPPTPKPGGRAKEGILYEFPSTGDLLHFIDHYNDGKTIGSLVMTSEGLYNIKKNINDGKKIDIDEDKFYSEITKTFRECQVNALAKYGHKFNTYKFYSIISQDDSFIKSINNVLKKYYLIIDFYPRSKDFKGQWIVDTIYINI
jgi:hypothetical protein